MKAIEFPEVNLRIAENQPEYETLPVCVVSTGQNGSVQITMCFELDENERKQVAETGQIWHTVLQHKSNNFHPIRMEVTKPEL